MTAVVVGSVLVALMVLTMFATWSLFAVVAVLIVLEARQQQMLLDAAVARLPAQVGETKVEVAWGTLRHALAELRLTHPGVSPSLSLVSGEGAGTGDPAFDEVVVVEHSALPAFWIAADAETRQVLGARVLSGLSVRNGVLSMPVTDAASLERWMKWGVALAERLAAKEPWLERAVARALHDPLPGVRTRVGRWLAAGPEVPAEAHVRLLQSSDPGTVLVAATHLRDRPALVALMEKPSVRAQAAAALARGVEPGEDAELEQYLIALVPHPSAIEALAHMGTVLSVPSLRAAEGLAITEGGQRARDAIRAIQTRAAGIRGTVALADDAGGRLSAATEQGGLSAVPGHASASEDS